MIKKNLRWNFDYNFNGQQCSKSRYVIYKIENTISGKIYIGQTRRMLHQRWANYKYDLLRPIQKSRNSGTNLKLKHSVQKGYEETGNIDFLKFSILEIINIMTATIDEMGKLLCDREEHYIKEYRITNGPDKICNVIADMRSYNFTDIDKSSISESKKKYYQTEEGKALKQKISVMHKGHKISEETRKKLSESHIGLFAGENHPLYGKKGELSSTYGLIHNHDSIEKMKQNRKGKNLCLDNHNTKTYDLSSNPLVSPVGEIHTQIIGLHPFCMKHGLSTTHLRNVIYGSPEHKSHKGWRLRSNMVCH